jgi:hypothetical protein
MLRGRICYAHIVSRVSIIEALESVIANTRIEIQNMFKGKTTESAEKTTSDKAID